MKIKLKVGKRTCQNCELALGGYCTDKEKRILKQKGIYDGTNACSKWLITFKDYSIYLRDQHPSAVVIDAIEGNKIEFEDRLTS